MFKVCQKEEKPITSSNTKFDTNFDSTSSSQSAVQKKDPLFEEKDESCDGSKKKLKEKITKQKDEAFKLQGGDTGCDGSGKS